MAEGRESEFAFSIRLDDSEEFLTDGLVLVRSPPPHRKYAASLPRSSSLEILGLSSSVESRSGRVKTEAMPVEGGEGGGGYLAQKYNTLAVTVGNTRGAEAGIPHSVSQPCSLVTLVPSSKNERPSSYLSSYLSPSPQTKTPFRRKSKQQAENPLHYPKNTETLLKYMERDDVDLNSPNSVGDLPIHAIIRRNRRKRADILMTLLVNGCSRVDINLCSIASGETALHLAVTEEEEMLVKMLLTFGAEVNPLDNHTQTPLDLAIARELSNIVAILVSVGGKTGDAILESKDGIIPVRTLEPFEQPFDGVNGLVNGDNERHTMSVPVDCRRSGKCASAISRDSEQPAYCTSPENEMVFSGGTWREVMLKDLEEGKASSTLYEKLTEYINSHLTFSESMGGSVDEAMAVTKQQRELLRYRKTQNLRSSLRARPRSGSRVLCLDGGGIRGLIQIEVLRQLELKTGAKVTDMFDWIVGTSTGGILALGLVYAKKDLTELRQLYFKLREKVFSLSRLGIGYNTESYEKVLKEEFGTEAMMSDIHYPRVLITAVYKKTNQPELHFFNNCFDNEFSKYPVWKVARYTSAAPLYFSEMDHYVDGAVLANNPCDYALTAINNYFRGDRNYPPPATNARPSTENHGDKRVALVVSIGTGIFPAVELGNTDAQRFLFFGKHWFKSKTGPFQTVENLITLLTKALMDSESVAENCQSRLQSQGVSFFRFNPTLTEGVPTPDVSRDELLNMIMQTRYETMGVQMEELVDVLHQIRTVMKHHRH